MRALRNTLKLLRNMNMELGSVELTRCSLLFGKRTKIKFQGICGLSSAIPCDRLDSEFTERKGETRIILYSVRMTVARPLLLLKLKERRLVYIFKLEHPLLLNLVSNRLFVW
jgi:hypothetical protein